MSSKLNIEQARAYLKQKGRQYWQEVVRRTEPYFAHAAHTSFSTLEDFRGQPLVYLQHLKQGRGYRGNASYVQVCRQQAAEILDDCIMYYGHLRVRTDWDWLRHPFTGYRYSLDPWEARHLDSPASGDIRDIWELARFSWILPVIRHDYYSKEDHSAWVFARIDAWIAANPVNQGPNWRSSSEIAIRLWNWYFALAWYTDSSALTLERWSRIQQALYEQLQHIFRECARSRKRGQQVPVVVETGMLYLSRWLFPYIPQTATWSVRGQAWFEEEVDTWIQADGTMEPCSMDMQRGIVQVLTAVISGVRAVGAEVTGAVEDKAFQALKFLQRCQDVHSGRLPNFGENHHAWFFPWSGTDYADFRPTLHALHTLLTQQPLYTGPEFVREESVWWNTEKLGMPTFHPLKWPNGVAHFPLGGFLVLREEEVLTCVRCTSTHTAADLGDHLHLDIWINGENVVQDTGSYRQIVHPDTPYFRSAAGHNTLAIEGVVSGQQAATGRVSELSVPGIQVEESNTHWKIVGTVQHTFPSSAPLLVRRTIVKEKGIWRWTVQDEVIGWPEASLPLVQYWHIAEGVRHTLTPPEASVVASHAGWRSLYYGQKTLAIDQAIRLQGRQISTVFHVLGTPI